MNETISPAPPTPKGYNLIIDRDTAPVMSLFRGDIVFDHSAPELGWGFVDEDNLKIHPKNAVSIATLHKASVPQAPTQPESVLQEAERLINGDRQQAYGSAAKSFERIAAFWHAYLKHKLKDTEHIEPKDVAAMMILMKVSRSVTSSKRDNWVDAAAYAELGSQLDTEQP
jgi:hypothetical protein